jgi:hypothetical protein
MGLTLALALALTLTLTLTLTLALALTLALRWTYGGARGSDPFYKSLMLSTSHTPPLDTQTSTEENGSGWAAQRLGRRLALCRLE